MPMIATHNTRGDGTGLDFSIREVVADGCNWLVTPNVPVANALFTVARIRPFPSGERAGLHLTFHGSRADAEAGVNVLHEGRVYEDSPDMARGIAVPTAVMGLLRTPTPDRAAYCTNMTTWMDENGVEQSGQGDGEGEGPGPD